MNIRSIWLYTLLTLTLAASACMPMVSVPNHVTVFSPEQPTSYSSLLEQYQNKPPYQGPVKLKVNTGLLDPNSSQVLDLTAKLNPQNSFSLQSLPTGNIVFQETFAKDKGMLEVVREFAIQDTSKRYTLHVAKHANNGKKGQLTVNINGTNWIRERDFSKKDVEAEQTTLLLNANNFLRVRLNGEKGFAVTVTLVEGGEAGTMLRRRGKLGKPGETQATHVRRNDTNIFNPNIPNSLGGLEPYDGHLPNHSGVTGVSVDGQTPVLFEAGTLVLQLNNPETVLPLIEESYGVEVIKALEIPNLPDLTTYYLRFDLARSPVERAEELIRNYRENIPAYFNDFVFASPDAFQTFVILLDLLVEHPAWIQNWELNQYEPEPAESLSPIQTNDWNQPAASNPVSSNGRGWWLRDTFVREAWKLSIGTGVRVAYIDRGYQYLLTNTGSHPEIERHRILLDSQATKYQNMATALHPDDVQVDSLNPGNPLSCEDAPPPPGKKKTDYCSNTSHGLSTLIAGFAQRDNGIGTAGVAPNAQIRPFNADGFTFAYTVALGNILINKIFFDLGVETWEPPDVIGFNQQWYTTHDWRKLACFENETGGEKVSGCISSMAQIMEELSTGHNIPIVVAAGNSGSRRPGGKTPYPNDFFGQTFNKDEYGTQSLTLLIAGGATRDNTIVPSVVGGTRYDPNPSGQIFSYPGSTISTNAIWIPGSRIEISNNEATEISNVTGTSYSCPFLTATVALMKSRNPDLTPLEIYNILKSSPTKIDVTHEAPTIPKQPFIDVQYAVEEAIKAKSDFGNTVDSALAREFPGKIIKSGNQLKLKTNNTANSGTPEEELELLQTIGDNAWNQLNNGDFVLIRGWQGGGNDDGTGSPIRLGRENRLLSNQLEISQLQNLGPTIGSNFAPVILDAKVAGSLSGTEIPSGAFTIEVEGERLMANFTSSATKSMSLILHEYKAQNFTGNSYTFDMDFLQAGEFLRSSGEDQKQNLDSYRMKAAFVLDPSIDTDLTQLKKEVDGYTYKIIVKGSNGKSPEFPAPASGSSFSVKAEGSPVGFSVKSTIPAQGSLPTNSFLYSLPGVPYYMDGQPWGVHWLLPNQTIQVNANEFAGITFNQPVKGLSVKIGPVDVPIIDLLNDLAVIGIPEDLPAGIHDVVINSTVGSLTLENAVEKVSEAVPVYPEPETPPSTDPGRYDSVRVFNVEGNDEARAYLNDQLIATAHAGDDIEVSLGGYSNNLLLTDQRNEFRFELDNNGGGYTRGFELRDSSYRVHYRDVQGKAGEQNILNAQGLEDRTQGKVYNERFVTHQAAALSVGSGPYWIKVFNLNDDESLFIRASNRTSDPEWNYFNGSYYEGGYLVSSSELPFSKALPWPVDCPGYGGCGVISNQLFFDLNNPIGNYSYGIEFFKGLNLIYRNIHGEKNSWGADDNSESSSQQSEISVPKILDY